MLDFDAPGDTIAAPRAAQALPDLRVLLAAPRGFCAGVRRAIDAVTDALERHGPPVYVRRPIVHNLTVVRALEARGAVFVEELSEVPEGAVVILSAHGVAPAVAAEARARGLIAYDAVCPLVAKVHREVVRHHKAGRHVVLVGHAGHPEIAGTLGHLPDGAATLIAGAGEVAALPQAGDAPMAYAVQTTYSADEAAAAIAALEARFSDLAGPASSDICYATTNRQAAVRAIAPRVDAMIVAGESFSSNACRLAEVAAASGCPSVQRAADAAELDWSRLPRGGSVGVTAAASTPESVVQGLIAALATRYRVRVEEVAGEAETTAFKPVKLA
ncbi:MAG: 4-hydroxy-3-methylbut-2-enyl diphosphate reductase [Allosphingosinicella sp.]